MIRHIFIGTFKPEIDDAIKNTALADLRTMQEKIPGIVDLHANIGTGWVGSENSIAMTVDFANKADFDAYMTHPYHTQHVARQGSQFLSGYVAAQIELNAQANELTFEQLVEKITERINQGTPPVPACEDVRCQYSSDFFAKYNYVKATEKFFSDLLAVCDAGIELKTTFKNILRWCNQTENFPSRRVVLFTDKWSRSDFRNVEVEFSKFKERGVKFDFRLAAGSGCVKISF